MDINSEVSCGKGKAQTTAIYAKMVVGRIGWMLVL